VHLTDRSDATGAGRAWLRLYPRAWRDRYATELLNVLDAAPFTVRTRLDLVRGALDAHAHPLTPSLAPIVAALIAGIAWLTVGFVNALQPLMPDWPGFLLETIPVGVVGGVAALRAVTQVARRSGLCAPRGTALSLAIAVVGHALWIVAVVTAALGGPYGAVTGATGAIAALSTVLVGAVRSRADDHPTAEWLLIAGGAMLIPSPAAWVVAGGAWIGLAVTSLRPVVPLHRA
jgi:hypothetical protein